jgi:hypothetical protein
MDIQEVVAKACVSLRWRVACPPARPKGQGVDMTPEMAGKAQANAVKGGFQNVEFRL